jgi:hypothetical protein
MDAAPGQRSLRAPLPPAHRNNAARAVAADFLLGDRQHQATRTGIPLLEGFASKFEYRNTKQIRSTKFKTI